MRLRLRAAALTAALSLLLAACDRNHISGPDEPAPVAPPRLVDVTIEYIQPNECVAGSPRCVDNVAFFGSWMRDGEQFFLRPEPGRFVWRGVARNVPVNFPPTGQAHYVRVFDPHLVATATGGVTAERLKVGGEALTMFDSPGTTRESGRVYIDENGRGHNPFI